MSRSTDLGLAALAPVIWGTTYVVTTQMLPPGYPLTAALLRALPAGLLLLAVTRVLPPRAWLGRLAVLGALNFTLFWAALFVAAYRLPGGVAATLGAVQPLVVLGLARLVLGTALTPARLIAACAGLCGVAALVLGPEARLDPLGAGAALAGALSMGLGTVLTRRWQPPVPALPFTAWQLTAGGLLLLPLALVFEPALPAPDAASIGGFLWLGLAGAALSYFLWFRGIARLGPETVTGLSFLSPLTAVLLGWLVRAETLSPLQLLGAAVVLGSVFLGVRAGPGGQPAPNPR
ncbi:EamA family transporter [Pseudogemmobacter sonorensis]|uniref:EamA family transporter n=1 Tax=Pseudogemmobacter sonorensis TaxID=2989681 RepID=UPI003678CC99